jgi:predicted NBD/HSP70 family sugar kinase
MYLAIDIGGTKTLITTFNAKGRLLESIRFETPKEYSDFLIELGTSFSRLKDIAELKQCVVGAPGRIDRDNGVVIAYGNLAWENTPLAADIKKICKVPVVIENDANLAGLSEAVLIKHAYRKVLYITISTGIGGVMIVDGIIDRDYADTEFGHMVFEHNGKLMKWQEFASGKAIFNEYGKKASEIEDPETWYKISRNIALGLTDVIVNLTPEVVIIGGGVGTHFDKYADALHEELLLFGSKLVSAPPLRKAIRAEEAVIYGCYELAHQLHN